MKKILYSVFAIAALALTTVFTSCESEEEEKMVCTVATDVAGYVYNVSEETKAQIIKTNDALEARAQEVLGKTFKLPIDEEHMLPTTESITKCNNKLKNDSKFVSLVDKFHEFKTLDGGQAITEVYIYYYCGTKQVAEWDIEIVN
ncbi:MAG: hypothetical protein MJZ20_01905 [Bacteroidaceae bacterium]|nr:hypothetical protein [Bacteroidaceae bacterium]